MAKECYYSGFVGDSEGRGGSPLGRDDDWAGVGCTDEGCGSEIVEYAAGGTRGGWGGGAKARCRVDEACCQEKRWC